MGEGETAPHAFGRVSGTLFDYDIFPPTLVGYRIMAAGPIGRGCTIVQRFRLAGR